MGMTIYCSSCGAKHTVEIKKPKFCSACGEPIDKAFKKEQPKPSVSSARVQKIENDEDENVSVEIAQGSVSDFEVVVKKKITLGDLSKMGNPINRGNGGANAGLPTDVDVTSKNFFANLDS